MDDLPWMMEKQVEFIRLYKQRPLLWNPRDKNYKNKLAKKIAWSTMSKILETDTQALIKRMKNMMSQFSREKARLKIAFRSNPKSSLPEPKWYLFREMEFLLEKFEPSLKRKLEEEGVNIDLVDDEEAVHLSGYEDNKSDFSGDAMTITSDVITQTNLVPLPLVITTNEKKWQADPLSGEQEEVKNIQIKRICNTDRNRAFVEYVYEVLRDLEVGRAANLRHSIHELLHKAELEQSCSLGPTYIKEDLS